MLDIPSDLLDTTPKENDVSILIGENGSGKSELLNKISIILRSKGRQVIAISNSVHDKFTKRRSKYFHFLGGRHGRNQARDIIKNALQKITYRAPERLKFINLALEYVGYDARIGIRINSKSPMSINRFIQTKHSPRFICDHFFKKTKLIDDHFSTYDTDWDLDERIESFYSFLTKTLETRLNQTIWLETSSFDAFDLRESQYTLFTIWEQALKQLNLIDDVEILLSKNEEEIPLSSASSGELSVISSIVYAATVVDENTVILIDEPENSLHPKWQREYLPNILDIFYFYQPKIIVATHSPLIVSGAETSITECKVFAPSSSGFSQKSGKYYSVERMLLDLFGIVTPENRYLSTHFVSLLKQMKNKEISIEKFTDTMERISEISYDERQKSMVEGAKKIAMKIASQEQ